MRLDAGQPMIHGRQPLRDRAQRRRVVRRPAVLPRARQRLYGPPQHRHLGSQTLVIKSKKSKQGSGLSDVYFWVAMVRQSR
jgi:hypothetical protein